MGEACYLLYVPSMVISFKFLNPNPVNKARIPSLASAISSGALQSDAPKQRRETDCFGCWLPPFALLHDEYNFIFSLWLYARLIGGIYRLGMEISNLSEFVGWLCHVVSIYGYLYALPNGRIRNRLRKINEMERLERRLWTE